MRTTTDWYPFSAIIIVIVITLSGCAGPTTPLGAPWATSSAEVSNGPLAFISSLFRENRLSVRFEPEHQILHGAHPVTITVTDPGGIRSNYRLVVRHNGLEVTGSFLRQAHIEQSSTQLKIHVPVLRLPSTRDHLIEVIYGSGSSDLNAYARYEAPTCKLFDPRREIKTTARFIPDKKLLSRITEISKSRGFSPAFTAGLIAQESGFNPRTVSWAKAIGLTQVTSLAEHEIVAHSAEWPRYPGINELPAFFVKALVATGSANPKNEWRLDTSLSIDGGLAFTRALAERWSSPESLARIRQLFKDPDEALTKLVLASYNSGYARVQTALARLGANWLTAPELKEARNYVNRVSSYCDHFSAQKGGLYE